MRTQRLRDPIHDMVVFDETLPLDQAAWNLLKSPDLQRLRRIKQLGVSEFVFPGATHNRFAHSVGVFQNARRLVEVLRREVKLKRADGSEVDEIKAKEAVLAALLHDIGHGPFSHAFEEARKIIAKSRSGDPNVKIEKHEAFTAKMILDPAGQIGEIITDLELSPENISKVISSEIPDDMYSSIVSSSFDADRLDYLSRDRFMTGVGSGALDVEWLLDNVRVALIDFSPPESDGTDPMLTHSFCLLYKARDAAEDFLLARYRLYTNVYFHKTTRGMEQLMSYFFRLCAEQAWDAGKVDGISANNPITSFFSKGGDTLENYRLLDDTVVWGALNELSVSGNEPFKSLAQRILKREVPKCLDIQNEFPADKELQRRLKHSVSQKFRDRLGTTVLFDRATLSIYGEVGADDSRAHKRLMILGRDERPREITSLPYAMVSGSAGDRPFERYYFLNESDYTEALGCVDSVAGRA